jgi:hypothetical protein
MVRDGELPDEGTWNEPLFDNPICFFLILRLSFFLERDLCFCLLDDSSNVPIEYILRIIIIVYYCKRPLEKETLPERLDQMLHFYQ